MQRVALKVKSSMGNKKVSNLKVNWQNIQRSKKIGIIIGSAALFAFIAIGGFSFMKHNTNQQAGIPSTKAETSYVLSKTDDFNTLNTTDWQTYDKTLYARSQAYYMLSNTYVKDGNLVILTRRHCIDSTIDLSVAANRSVINDTTASVAPCAAGKQTVYSSGYLTSKFRVPNGKVEFRAKVPVQQKGYWLGLWLRNVDGWCTSNYGEMDAVEVYGDNPKQTTATSHISCVSNSTKKVQHASTLASLLSDNWHVWSIEWDTTKIVYKMDGVVVPTTSGNNDSDTSADTAQDFANKAVTASQFYAIMNQAWESRLEVQVTASGDAWHPAPDNTANYNAMETLIDYVKWYVPGTPSPTPVSDTTAPVVTPTSPAALSTIKGTATTSATATDNVGVAKAELYVNNVLKQTITGAGPYSTTFDTANYANGSTVEIVWKAYDAAGNVGLSNTNATVNNATIDTVAPSTPTNVAVDPVDLTAGVPIAVNWSPSIDNIGVTQYYVTRDGGYAVGYTATTTFNDSTADKTVCTTYCHTYIIYALDAAGNKSSGSTQAVGKVRDSTAPSVPTNVSASASAYNKVSLSWAASTDNVGVAGYYIVRGGTTLATVSATVATAYVDSSVSANTQYAYQVIAYDVAGNTAASSSVSVSTPAAPDTVAPSVPQGLSAKAVSAAQINLSWAASTDNIGVTSYKIYRNGTNIATVSSSVTTSYGDTNLSASTMYSYTVAACDASVNCSVPSAASSATTLAVQTVGSLTGLVSGQTAGAISRAKVRISNGANNFTTYTNSSGQYSFGTLVQGGYAAAYSAKGYTQYTGSISVTGGSPTVNNVTLNKR